MSSSLVQADFTFTKYISSIAKVKAPFKMNSIQFVLDDTDAANPADFDKMTQEGIIYGNATNYSRSVCD
jgi:hypothetical protein